MSKIVTIWGNSGAYKTSTAVKVATKLAKHGDTILLSVDNCKPSLPILLPMDNTSCSLGKVLSEVSITNESICRNMMTVKGLDLCVIGYRETENRKTYAEYTVEKATEFLSVLRELAEYIVIDCTSNIANNVLTAVSLLSSDCRLYLASADLNGIAFYGSQFPLLEDRFKPEKHIKILSLPPTNVDVDINTVAEVIGNIEYEIPYSAVVRSQMNYGALFETASDTAYNSAIENIIGGAILV